MTGFIDTKGKNIAEKGVRDIVRTASKIYELIRGNYKILDKEIVINCPDLIQKYSVLFQATGGVGKVVSKKIKFPFGKPVSVVLRPLRSLQEIPNAITINEEGFEISTQGMSKDDELSLDVEYNIRDIRFIDALVHKNVLREVPKDKENEYWMHAELKHPKALRTTYGKLDLHNLDFNVDVGISEDIKMQIPSSFTYELKTAVDLLSERDWHKKAKLGVIHAKAMRERRKKENVVKLLGNLQKLFDHNTFRRFVEVKKDFYLYDCQRGISFHDSTPFPTWPKTMKVISRTNLGIEKFAADGILYYKKGDFLDRVSKILGL